ncbi:MAG TPA: DHHA1 domain-containing protein [Anaerolineae bacterium]|nr:DHHA1 domain-containing protein [Anaerolineae bacterium]
MTQRLYYETPYPTTFDAQVIDARQIDGRPAVALEITAFYPTGGGQPHDTGALDGVAVLDVRSDGETIWHLLAAPLPVGSAVHGRLDWQRRWDHMQNHSGQHILSQAFIETAGALTVAWHMSEHSLTIDLDQTGLSDGQLADTERLANQVVQRNLPVSARVVSEQELPTLNLRKQPDVDGPLRIVEIGDFDRVACGGLHVGSTAQVGLVKVLRAERRGPETRIHFACGQRALDDYNRKHQMVRGLASRFTCSEEELPQAVERLQAQADANFKALRAVQRDLVAAEAARLLATAGSAGRLSGEFPGWEGEQVKALALALRSQPGLIIALAGGNDQVLLARSADVTFDAGQTLRSALATVGGRGGGRPDFAQGAAPSWEAARQALNNIIATSAATN